MAYDILLDENDEIMIQQGDCVVGESTMQEVGILLRMNQGHDKDAPLIGPNLVKYVKSNISADDAESIIALHLKMDGKDYTDIKKQMTIKS